MGLHLDRKVGGKTGHRHWFLPAGIIALSILLAAGGDSARQWLRYDRASIESGEVWRLLSGHFAHLGLTHLALNLAGLILVWALVGNRMSNTVWLAITSFVVAFISGCFWFLDENLIWYVGLSGLLHGLLISGACVGLTRWRAESIAILVLVFGKIAYEQFSGPLPGSELTSGGPVVVNAHLYGAIAGLVIGLARWHRVERSSVL
jgi:rhomboid family GlyGly-CTERM serine protease